MSLSRSGFGKRGLSMSDVTMSDREVRSAQPTEDDRPAWDLRWIGLGLLPLILLAGVLALIVATDAGLGDREVPPIETLNVQRVTLPEPNRITVDVVNDGPDEITIAQVLVDDAYWQFELDGPQTLD